MQMKSRKLFLSTSSIKTYLTCKKKFKYKHIDKNQGGEGNANKYMSFGNSMHMALAEYNLITNEKYKTLDILHNLLRKNWIRDGYDSVQEERDFGMRGLDMLTHYYNNPQDKSLKNLIIEEMIFKEAKDYVLCGKLDKVYQREDQVVEILDYKTGKSIEPIDNIQLPLYLILAEAKLGYFPDSVSFYYLSRNEKHTQNLDDRHIAKSIRHVFEICDMISEETNFEANPNTYCNRNCEYYAICDDAKNIEIVLANSMKQLDRIKYEDVVF
jgi:CRISPR/Cas system-associated exonuclease Cas4 (RecB family)